MIGIWRLEGSIVRCSCGEEVLQAGADQIRVRLLGWRTIPVRVGACNPTEIHVGRCPACHDTIRFNADQLRYVTRKLSRAAEDEAPCLA